MSKNEFICKETENIVCDIVKGLREEVNVFAKKRACSGWDFYIQNGAEEERILGFDLSEYYKPSKRFVLIDEKKKTIRDIAKYKDKANRLIYVYKNKNNMLPNVMFGCVTAKAAEGFEGLCFRIVDNIIGMFFVRLGSEFIPLDDKLLDILEEKGICITDDELQYAMRQTFDNNKFEFTSAGEGILSVKDKFGISSSLVASIATDWVDKMLHLGKSYYILLSGIDSITLVEKKYIDKVIVPKDDTVIMYYDHSIKQIRMRLQTITMQAKNFSHDTFEHKYAFNGLADFIIKSIDDEGRY